MDLVPSCSTRKWEQGTHFGAYVYLVQPLVFQIAIWRRIWRSWSSFRRHNPWHDGISRMWKYVEQLLCPWFVIYDIYGCSAKLWWELMSDSKTKEETIVKPSCGISTDHFTQQKGTDFQCCRSGRVMRRDPHSTWSFGLPSGNLT